MNDTQLCEVTLLGVNAILGEGGLAYVDQPTLRFNPQQLEYATRAAKGFCHFENNKTGINMLQSATGLGKTLGYLVPLLLISAHTGKRVGVSTHSRYLQRQIIDKDVQLAAKWVQAHTGKTLSYALRMGRSNFVCTTSVILLKAALTDEKADAEAISFLEDLIAWNTAFTRDNGCDKLMHSGILDDFLQEQCIDEPPAGITRLSLCLQSKVKSTTCLAYQASLKEAENADVVVFNHSLMVFNSLRWAQEQESQLNPIQYMVFDEADLMAPAAESILSHGISLHRMHGQFEDLYALTKHPALGQSMDAVKATLTQMEKLSPQGSGKHRHIQHNCALAQSIITLQQVLRTNLLKLGEVKKASDQVELTLSSPDVAEKSAKTKKTISGLLTDLRENLNGLTYVKNALEPKSTHIVLMGWSPVRKYPSLSVGDSKSGQVYSRLWNKLPQQDRFGDDLPPRSLLRGVLLTSATLSAPGGVLPACFDTFASSIGAIRHNQKSEDGKPLAVQDAGPVHNCLTDLYGMFQPKKFGAMSFVLAGPDAPAPRIKAPLVLTTPSEVEVTLDDLLDSDSPTIANPAWVEYTAKMIAHAQSSGGRTLVLVPSWRDTNAITEQLQLLGVTDLIVHQRGVGLRSYIGAYRDNPKAILLSPAAWEGVDLPGLVQNLVITRIPFLPPDSVSSNRQRVVLAAAGLESSVIRAILRKTLTNSAQRKFEQGLGRGLRAASDCVTVYIADKRFPAPMEYMACLHSALLSRPAFSQTHKEFNHCIPTRFRNSTYPQAKLYLGTPHAGQHLLELGR